MSREAIMKIRETEAEAARIRARGAEKAKEILREAEAEGVKLCETAESRAAEENREKLAMTREKAEQLLAKTRAEAKKENEKLRESRSDRIRDGVRMIIGGLFEKCQ